MATLINRTISEHKGAPRIYLDGTFLDEFTRPEGDTFYDRLWDGNKLILRLNENGKYKVSSKAKAGNRIPIIDINTRELAEQFEVNSKLRIAIKKGYIVIQAHASETAIIEREEKFINAIRNGETLKIGSLFHGGGVMDNALHDGFAKSGLATAVSFAVELESKYLQSSMRNNTHLFDENTVFINSDVADLNINAMPPVHGLYGGIPCTGASVAGRAAKGLQHAEEHDSAGACFFSYLTTLKAVNPAFAIIENVKQYMQTASFSVIKSVLGSLGYDLIVDVFKGTDFGASEARERMICIAISKGLNSAGFLDDVFKTLDTLKAPATPLADVLDDLALDDPAWREVPYLKAKEKRDLASGKGFKMQMFTQASPYTGVLTAGYAKSRSTDPRLQHPTDPELSRLFNKHEHARIKKVPEYIVDGLSETIAHQILGNGVIWSLFSAIGQAIGSVATSHLGSHQRSLKLVA